MTLEQYRRICNLLRTAPTEANFGLSESVAPEAETPGCERGCRSYHAGCDYPDCVAVSSREEALREQLERVRGFVIDAKETLDRGNVEAAKAWVDRALAVVSVSATGLFL